MFKIRHAEEFDTSSAQEVSSGQVMVKREHQNGDSSASAYTQPVVVIPASPSVHALHPADLETPQRAVTVQDEADHEDVFVAILSQASWDIKMTEMTMSSLSERTERCAGGGRLFDMEYLDTLFKRLDSTGIDAERRTQVVALLQKVFIDWLSHWRACIEQIGNTSSARILPYNLIAEAGRSMLSSTATTPSRTQLLNVDDTADLTHSRGAREGSDSTCNDSGAQDASEERQGGSEYSTAGSDDLTISTTENSFATSSKHPSMVPRGERAVDNKRVYGTVCPKAPFDVFARAVIAA